MALNKSRILAELEFEKTIKFLATTPFTVSSNVLINNLNAEYLNGHQASDFALVNHTHVLNDLSDVNASSPTSGQVLTWDGSAWVPQDVSSGSTTAASVTVDTSNFNNILTSNENTVQKALDKLDDHSHSLDNLTDVSTSGVATNNVLYYNGSQWAAGPVPSHSHTSSNISDFEESVEDVVGTLMTNSATINFTYNDSANTLTADVIEASSIQKVNILKSGTLIGAQHNLNFLDGNFIETNIANDNGNNKIDITINHATVGTTAYPSSALTGADVISQITLDNYGHVNGINTRSISASDIGAASASHTHTLVSLTDTNINSPASGQILKFDGTSWINDTLAGMSKVVSFVIDDSSGIGTGLKEPDTYVFNSGTITKIAVKAGSGGGTINVYKNGSVASSSDLQNVSVSNSWVETTLSTQETFNAGDTFQIEVASVSGTLRYLQVYLYTV